MWGASGVSVQKWLFRCESPFHMWKVNFLLIPRSWKLVQWQGPFLGSIIPDFVRLLLTYLWNLSLFRTARKWGILILVNVFLLLILSLDRALSNSQKTGSCLLGALPPSHDPNTAINNDTVNKSDEEELMRSVWRQGGGWNEEGLRGGGQNKKDEGARVIIKAHCV